MQPDFPKKRILTPVDVFTILVKRLERRIHVLERASLSGGYAIAVHELGTVVSMLRKAREFLHSQNGTR
jgi:hypothetical protein